MRFAATFDANGVRKGAAEAVASMKSVSVETDKASASLRNVAKDAGHYYDALGHLHRADGKFASSAESAAVKAGTLTASVRKATDQTRALGSSSEKAGKQIQGFGSGSDSASKSLAKASSVADALNQRFASLTQRVLSVYAAYKLLDGVVAATNIGIQANAAWESQKLSIASIVSSTNQLADAQGRVLEGSEKFVASQQVAEKLMQRLQQLGLETTATTQELVNGFQAIIAPALKAGYALEEIPELATRAAQAMGAFQIPIQQMRTEVEALLSGNINKAQDLLAPYLNISKELVKEWKAQGVLVEEINKRLESFKYSGDAIANTWEGLVSNTKEYVEFISRGSTDGLFNSMKASISQLQQLLITFNKETGKPEISQNINNIREAYERLNNFIGDKILTATYAFSDALRNLNDADTLANLETTFSNVWDAVVSIGTGAGEAALEIGSIATAAIDGWNNLPDTIREIGLFGIALYGKKGVLALAGVAIANRFIQNTMKAIALVQSGELSNSEWASMTGDELEEWIKNYEKKQKQSIDAISGYSKDKNAEALMFIRNQYREQTASLEKELQEQQRLYDIYSQNAKNYDFDIYGREAAQEQADNIAQRIDAIKSKLNEVTDALHSINQEATSFDLEELFPTAPFSDATASLAGLLTTSRLFGQSLFTAKKAVNDLDGATAEVSFNLNFAGGAQNFLSGDPGEGTPFAIDAWRQATLGFFKEMQDGIRATSTLGKTAADDGKKKAKQIESALHSVESELNKLQMTDAQYRQWQVDEKVEKLEKLLGSTNPKVIELRTSLQKELNDNLFKDVLKFANPAAAAVATVEKEYDDWKKNLEQLKKQAPDKYAKLMAENINLMADAQRQYNNALEQAKSTFINFRKETADIYAQSTMTDEEYFVYQTNRQIEEWEKQGQSRADIDERVNALLLQRNNKYSADFGKMWEETYNRVDQAGADMLENFLSGTKNTFDSLKKMFIRTLAEMANAAWLRPITVQIMGTLGGVFGVGGTALAYDSATGKMVNASAGGLLGNVPLSNLSSFLPDSFTSSLSGIMGATLPGTVSALTTPGAYTAGEILLMQGGGTTAGTVGGQAALMSGGLSLGSALMYGGLGSLGYSLLGGALGLPQNKYSGITSGLGAGLGAWGASAALSGTALGATLGSAVPVVGTVIGAALGGLASSLVGCGMKTHPSDYTNVVDASLFGSDWEALMTQGAWTDRASVSDAAGIFKGLGEVANTTASSIMGFAQALPEEYQAQVLARLNAETVSFGRGSTAGRKGVTDYGPSTWNFQFHDEEQLQEVINTAGEDIQRVMLNALQQAMAGTDLSSMLAVDLSSTEGLDKAIQAINAINTVTEATANIKEPLSEMEQQAKAARAQLDEWTESMRSLGVNADYAGKLMEDYRHAYIDNVIESLDESLHPLSAYAQAVKAANEAVDQRKNALEIIGATESQLAQVEAMRAEVVKQATEEMLRSFDQSVAQRWAAVNGNSDEVGRAISQANELRETIRQFGEGSAQVAELLKLHAAETAKAVQDAAQAAQDAAKAAADSFRQTYAQRYATLTGDTNGLANLQQDASHRSELEEIAKAWGVDSEQYRQMQALQDAEAAKQRLQQAQAAYDALQAQLEKQQAELKQLEQQAVQLQIEEIQKLQTASKERITALEKELSSAQKLHDTWEDVFATAYKTRLDLYKGNTNLDVFGRLDTAQGEFDRLYGLAIGGDADAAKEMAGVASELLGLRGETTANRDDYLDAFYDVDKKLKEVSAYADAQVSDAQKQIDTLQAQLEAENAQYSILVSQLSAQQAALSALNGQTQTLASIQAQIAKLKTEINITIDGKNVASSTVDNAQGDYDDAKDHVDQTKPVVGIYGSKYLTEYDLLVAKVASLNRGEFVNADADTRDWTVAKARQAMIGEYGSVKNWYLQIGGPVEGFERGGFATPGGSKMFGERGIEYGDVEQPTRIYDATKTRLMLEGGHEYAREAYKGMAEFSRMLARTSGVRGDGNKEETAALRREVRELRGMLKSMLTSVVKNTKDARDFLEEFEESGLPPQRVNA